MCVCLSVCLFSTEIQTDGHIRMKFGTKVVLEGGKVRPDTPHAPPHDTRNSGPRPNIKNLLRPMAQTNDVWLAKSFPSGKTDVFRN